VELLYDRGAVLLRGPRRLVEELNLPELLWDPRVCELRARLVGPVVCCYSVSDFSGSHLAPFEQIALYVKLSASERSEYVPCYEAFSCAHRAFFRSNPHAPWSAFVAASSRTPAGRTALASYHRARRIVGTASRKLRLAETLLMRHAGEPAFLFCADNAAAYALSRRLLVPAITCDIGRKEREGILQRLRDGRVRALVSAQVLNEGVDVPDARVGIVLGGSLGKREHIQRVGRLLRPREGKTALVYEIIARDTHEERQSQRRRGALAA